MIIAFIQDRFPCTFGLFGLTSAALARWLEGPAALVALLVGLCTLIILSPKAYRQVRIWWRWGRRNIWPSRRRRDDS